MDKILKYSVLRYSPSAIAGEKINLGIIFYDEASGYREFKYSKKFSRLTAFDDEIDVQMVKHMLKSINDDVNGNIFTYNTFDINAYTKYFMLCRIMITKLSLYTDITKKYPNITKNST